MESIEFQEQQQDFDTSIASPSPIVKAASEPVIIRASPTITDSTCMDSSDENINYTCQVSGMRLADVPNDTTTYVPYSSEYLADEGPSDASMSVEIDEISFYENENSRIQQDNLSYSSSNEYPSSTFVHPAIVNAIVQPIPRISLNRYQNISVINDNQSASAIVPSRTWEEEESLIPIRENYVPVRRAKEDISVPSSAIVSITNSSTQDIPTDCPSLKNDSDTASYESAKPHTVRFHILFNKHLSAESRNSEYIDNNFLLRNTVYSDNILIALSKNIKKIPVPDTKKLTFVLTLIKRTENTSTYISDQQSIKCQFCQKDMILIFYFFAVGVLCIYDKPKKPIHLHKEKMGTISMVHDECLGAQLYDYKCNYFLQVLQNRAPILQWWRKKKEMINVMETINLMVFCLIISYGMGYVFYINYSSELTIMQKTFIVILICIYILLIVWRLIYLVYVFRKNWKKLCKSNQIVQAIIWKYDMSRCILEEESCL